MRRAALAVFSMAMVLGAPLAPAVAAPDTPAYTVVELGSLSGLPGSITIPRAVQNPVLSPSVARSPMVVGGSTDAAGLPRPFVWAQQWGIVEGIGGLPGTGHAADVNIFGDYVGTFSLALGPAPYRQRAFLASTRMSAVHFMPTLGGPSAGANGINSAMTIVGWSQDAQNRQRATIWRSGEILRELGTFGGANSEAMAINNLGQVVGRAQRADGMYRAFLHDPVSPLPVLMVDLGSLSPEVAATARDINNHGRIVGWSMYRGPVITPTARMQMRAVMWDRSAGTISNLGVLNPLDTASDANAVNSHGQAVGWSGQMLALSSTTRVNQRAFLWDGQQMHDLNALIPPNSGWIIQSAEDINDAGMIAAWGMRVSPVGVVREVRGLLLVPQR